MLSPRNGRRDKQHAVPKPSSKAVVLVAVSVMSIIAVGTIVVSSSVTSSSAVGPPPGPGHPPGALTAHADVAGAAVTLPLHAASASGSPRPQPSRRPTRSPKPSPVPSPSEPPRPPNPFAKPGADVVDNPKQPWVEHAMHKADGHTLVTVTVAYYNQVEMLREQLQRWGTYSAKVRSKVEFVVVDDGSKTIAGAAKTLAADLPNANIKMVSLTHDIGFNQGGACNTGAMHASGEVLAFLDIDHWYTPAVAEKLVEFAQELVDEEKRAVYVLPREDWVMLQNKTLFKEKFHGDRDKFNRWNLDHSSPNCVVMRREVFWETGGYDEDFSGAWGWVDIAWKNCITGGVKMPIKDIHRHRIAGETDLVALFDSGGGVDIPKPLYGLNYDLYNEKRRVGERCNNWKVARVPHEVVFSQKYDPEKEPPSPSS